MPFLADLHVHSRYSRATSAEMSPEAFWMWAQLKGITVIGTGDFTHPEWFRELREKLEEDAGGLYRLKRRFRGGGVPDSCRADVFFLLSAEISCIYGKDGKTRKVHAVVFAPDFAAALRINEVLQKRGNLKSDGRPILGMDAKDLLKIVLDASPDAMLVPAHAWTPHFSIFGAASGFDSLEECFQELTPWITTIETGLSSNPAMNRRLSALDRITFISNSDAHSPSKIGREASIFGTEIAYRPIIEAMRTGKGFSGTVEFFPEEGKYHYDGHRACGVSLSPRETIGHDYRCPVCGKKVTVGVMHRVEVLADRDEDALPPGHPGFSSIIPLSEIIAETVGAGVGTKKVSAAYFGLLEDLGPEFGILMDRPIHDIESGGVPRLGEAISLMRSGDVGITPGFDGEYGKVRIFERAGKRVVKGQKMLF